MTPFRHSVRTWALVAVAVTSLFLMGMAIWFTVLLSQKDWCDRALGANRTTTTDGKIAGSDACFSLMRDQLAALSWNSHIGMIVIGMCLLVLVVIVLAGGKLSFTASRDGVSGDIGRDADVQAVADSAQDTADAIKESD